MNILYLSQHPALDPQRIATGNQLRDSGLIRELRAAGHQVTQLSPMPADGKPSPVFYSSQQELHKVLHNDDYQAVIAGYWTLLSDLPSLDIPVVVDVIAPPGCWRPSIKVPAFWNMKAGAC